MRASVAIVAIAVAIGVGASGAGAATREGGPWRPSEAGRAPKPWEREAPPPQFVPPPAKTGGPPAPFSSRGPVPFASHVPTPWPAPAGCQASSRLGGTIVHPGDPQRYEALIRDAARRHRIDAALVAAVIRRESAFDSRAISPAGAVGLMQLLPTTARRQGVHDVFAPSENIDAGCRYLRALLDRYQGDLRLALAAYNAGEQRVDVGRRVPRIPETVDYVEGVLRDYRARAGRH